MKKIILTIVMLTSTIWSAQAAICSQAVPIHSQAVPSHEEEHPIQEVKAIVNDVVHRHERDIMRRVPNILYPKMLNQLPICHYYSSMLKYYLDKETSLKTLVISSKNHEYLITENGIVIDATYRQFYTYTGYKRGFYQVELPKVFEDLNMPQVLIVPLIDLKDTLESYGFKPNWETHPVDCVAQPDHLTCGPTRYTYNFYYSGGI